MADSNLNAADFSGPSRRSAISERKTNLATRSFWKRVSRRIKLVILRTSLSDLILPLQLHRELLAWEKRGRTDPRPHLLKQSEVKEYAERLQLRTLIETGTYVVAMISAT